MATIEQLPRAAKPGAVVKGKKGKKKFNLKKNKAAFEKMRMGMGK